MGGERRWASSSKALRTCGIVGRFVNFLFINHATIAMARMAKAAKETSTHDDDPLSLARIADRPEFDRHWIAWIGADPDHWPQRACYQAALAPGLLIELIAVAAADGDVSRT